MDESSVMVTVTSLLDRLKDGRMSDKKGIAEANKRHVFTQCIYLRLSRDLQALALFLDASLHLYKRVCPSVGPSVCPLRLLENRSFLHFSAARMSCIKLLGC